MAEDGKSIRLKRPYLENHDVPLWEDKGALSPEHRASYGSRQPGSRPWLLGHMAVPQQFSSEGQVRWEHEVEARCSAELINKCLEKHSDSFSLMFCLYCIRT